MIRTTKYLENLTLDYCLAHSSALGDILYELERETHLKTLSPQMISGPLQGQFFSFISKMLRPKTILEIGTFTAYASICLAQGLAEGGILHTIEVNEELEYLIREYIEKAGLSDKIKVHIGDAKKIVPTLSEKFDLIFIDAGKNDNEFYYELAMEQLKSGGYILVDNVLWSGKVIQAKQDKDTQKIDAFNKKVQEDARVENLLLPFRDGIFLIRKR
ncbi:MAG: class I SAM-dependent methyltransferase [Bacteroidota bacterium]